VRGYVIVAVGDIKYKKCADTLSESIHRVMPDAKVTLITDQWVTNGGLYDKIVTLPYSDVDSSDWKLANDWQVYDASPYDETIKLEADMYIPRSIDYWWDILKNRELNISTTIRDFRGNISTNDYYRQTFVKSKLPQTYNAITYFKKGELAQRFFKIVRNIFENWSEYVQLLEYSSEDRPTTDVVYAIATKIIGVEHCTLPTFTEFSMTHMKPAINGNTTSIWYEEMVYEIHGDVFRINTYPQMYPIHYHNKEFAQIIDEELNDD
jgi:hypothetical protein